MSEHASNAGKILYMENGFFPVEDKVEEAVFPNAEADTLRLLFHALPEVDMDPMVQLAGFLTSDDPSYLPDHKGVRAAVTKIGREKLLRYLLHAYFEQDDHLEGKTL